MTVGGTDISEPLREICDRLGLTYKNVLTIKFRPGDLTATVALPDENGSKHIGVDGEIVKETREFSVLT